MRRASTAKGVTITELLTVVSVLTILTTLVSPLYISVKHIAIGRTCAHNIRQMHQGLELIANSNFGKLPPCVEVNRPSPPPPTDEGQIYPLNESGWWYRKVSAVLYPKIGSKVMDPLAGASLPAERCAMRCPASLDFYNQSFARSGYNTTSGGTDKDRVFDDSYGYNNFGFKYYDGSDVDRDDEPPIQNPEGLRWGYVAASFFYHTEGTVWGAIKGRPKHIRLAAGPCDCGRAWPCPFAYVGQFEKVPERARTLLLMDYIKADVAPEADKDGLWGYRFRHGGRANVLFMDGHLDVYSRQEFLSEVGTTDPVTGRTKIHWYVLRP